MKIEHLREVDSTNEYIKRYLPAGENRAVFADRQTGGRGTKGRSFLSEAGGVYGSLLLFPKNLPAREAFRIMAHAAVSVCKTAERFGARPTIKWANDVIIGTKKLCGILTENGIAEGKVEHSIVGIGVNVRNDVSALQGIAISLSECVLHAPTVDEVREKLIETFCTPSTFEEYCVRLAFLGSEVSISEGERTYTAIARAVLPDGRLLIEEHGKTRALSSAEIKLTI